MSKSHHRQHSRSACQWNPPPLAPDAPSVFLHPQSIASATECTGLEARPMLDRSEAEHAAGLYAIHQQKSQGNIGKDNPNNDPSEIEFHRG